MTYAYFYSNASIFVEIVYDKKICIYHDPIYQYEKKSE